MNSMIMGKHNRLSEDNIIRKIKARFHEKLRLYINNEYDKFVKKNNPNTKNKMNWLKKINPKISRKIKKEENLKWFNSKINEILSTNISTRYFSRSPDSNKKKIDRIISLNKANKIIEILNSKIFIFTILNGLSFLSLLLIILVPFCSITSRCFGMKYSIMSSKG